MHICVNLHGLVVAAGRTGSPPAHPPPRPFAGFLCEQEANVYGLEFQEFTIVDPATGDVLFDVRHHMEDVMRRFAQMSAAGGSPDPDLARKVVYSFKPSVLRCKALRTSLVFKTGGEPVKGLRMIERHYVGRKLLRNYEFDFAFCIPNSTNSWDAQYELPELSEEDVRTMVDTPYAHKSDSFYFVGDQLIMHNKAEYAYDR